MRSREANLWSAVAEGGTTGGTAFGLPVENASSFPIHTSPTCFPSEQYSEEASGWNQAASDHSSSRFFLAEDGSRLHLRPTNWPLRLSFCNSSTRGGFHRLVDYSDETKTHDDRCGGGLGIVFLRR
jgi:hypothetical protein